MRQDIDTLIDQAIDAFNAKAFDRALPLLEKVIENDPNEPMGHSLLGVIKVSKHDQESGLNALKRAVVLDPSHPQWQLNLGKAYFQLGHFQQAIEPLLRATELTNRAPLALIPLVKTLFAQGAYDEALPYAKELVNKHKMPFSWRMLAHIHANLGQLAEAQAALNHLNSHQGVTLADKQLALQLATELQQYDDAKSLLTELANVAGNNPEVIVTMTKTQAALGEFEQAERALRHVNQNHPNNPSVIAQLLNFHRTEAIGPAIDILNSESGTLSQRRAIAFGLARTFDSDKDYGQAWKYMSLANSMYEERQTYTPNHYVKRLEQAIGCFTSIPKFTPQYEELKLVYLLGAPRTGSTLLQSILSAAPGCHSLEERGALIPNLHNMLQKTAASDVVMRELGRADVAGIRALNPSADYYFDKTPHHAWLVGLLQRIHPQASFINVQRNHADTALSIFMHDFPSAFEYSRDIETIFDYLVRHQQAIEQWQHLGVDIISLDYADLVTRPDSLASLFERINLNWDSAYLEPGRRNNAVKNFSTYQARQPIHTASLGKWQAYLPYMGKSAAHFERFGN